MGKINKLAQVVAIEARKVTKKANEEIEPGEIYEKAKAILPKEDIDHHASDLYLRVSPKSTELVNSMKYRNSGMITTFKDNIDGDMWYELPFCYPFIESSKKTNVSKKAKELNKAYFTEKENTAANVELKKIDDLRKLILEQSNIDIIKNLAKAIIVSINEYKKLKQEEDNKPKK